MVNLYLAGTFIEKKKTVGLTEIARRARMAKCHDYICDYDFSTSLRTRKGEEEMK